MAEASGSSLRRPRALPVIQLSVELEDGTELATLLSEPVFSPASHETLQLVSVGDVQEPQANPDSDLDTEQDLALPQGPSSDSRLTPPPPDSPLLEPPTTLRARCNSMLADELVLSAKDCLEATAERQIPSRKVSRASPGLGYLKPPSRKISAALDLAARVKRERLLSELEEADEEADLHDFSRRRRRRKHRRESLHSTCRFVHSLGFLLGPGAGRALVGEDELRAVLPEASARVFVGTWNVAGERPGPAELRAWLRPEGLGRDCDVYVLGLQEGPPFESGFWEGPWERLLAQELGPNFLRFYTCRLGVLVLSVFVRRALSWFLSVPSHSGLMINPANPVQYYARTKGAVALSFSLFRTSFLFVNSHLSYGPSNNQRRIDDYRKIVAGLRPNAKKTAEKRTSVRSPSFDPEDDVTAKYDRVFWFGDLNFSTEGDRSSVESLALSPRKDSTSGPDFSELLDRDQLRREMSGGRIFCGFAEGRIRFPPTYKYDPGTHRFDSSAKSRVPAYTDRVLYRRNGSDEPTKVLLYESGQSLVLSDHKAVVGAFEVPIRPGASLLPMSRCHSCRRSRKTQLTAIKGSDGGTEAVTKQTSVSKKPKKKGCRIS